MATETHTAKTIFLAAVEKDSPDDRTAYLDQACAGNPTLRQRVDALLVAHDQPDSLLDHSLFEPLTEAASSRTELTEGGGSLPVQTGLFPGASSDGEASEAEPSTHDHDLPGFLKP